MCVHQCEIDKDEKLRTKQPNRKFTIISVREKTRMGKRETLRKQGIQRFQLQV